MQTQHRRYGALSSSQDPERLAAWVTGTLISFSSLIVFFASKFLGLPVTAEQVVAFAGPLGTVVGVIWTIFGVLRNRVSAITEKPVTN